MLGETDNPWRAIRCSDCKTDFKVPADLGEDDSVACPACGYEVAQEKEAEARPATTLPPSNRIPPGEAAPVDPPLADQGSVLPPPPKQVVSLDLSGLAVRDTNLTPRSEPEAFETTSPKLDNLDRLARTSDDTFAPIDEGPRERVGSKRAQRAIVGWDNDDEDEDDQEMRRGSQSTVATTFKLALFASPLLIGVAIFALNAQPKKVKRATPPDGPAGEQELVGVGADGTENTPAEPLGPPPPPPPDPESVMPLFEDLGQEEFVALLKSTLQSFLGAGSVAERIAHCRHPDRVRPLMEQHAASQPVAPVSAAEIVPNDNLRIDRGYAITKIVLEDGLWAPVVLVREGQRLVVDWESFVGHSEMTLPEFKAKKPITPQLFRVRARHDNYFNYGFEDTSHYCLSLSDLHMTERVYAYVEKDSPVSEEIYGEMAKASGLDFVMLRLRYPEDAPTDNQVIIDEFIRPGWIHDGGDKASPPQSSKADR